MSILVRTALFVPGKRSKDILALATVIEKKK